MQKIYSRWRWIAVWILIAGNSAPAAPDSTFHAPRLVMIIRHAEKPEASDGPKDPNLSKRGFERADALAKVIPDHFPKPDYLIATEATKGSNRPVETITPLAKALNQKIESTFKDEEFVQLAHAILTDPKYTDKTILIAWHHGKIPDLAKALGVTNAPENWDPQVFDRVWEITYENGTAHWKDLPQKAMPGDSEK